MTSPLTYNRPTADSLRTDAQAVVDAVTMDDSGMLVGNQWVGGNGGLLSRETLKAVDRLRMTIMALKADEQSNAAQPQRQEK